MLYKVVRPWKRLLASLANKLRRTFTEHIYHMTFQVIHIRKYIPTSVTFYVWRLDAYRCHVNLKTFFTAKQSRFKGEKKKLADEQVSRTGWKRLSSVQFNSSWYITCFGKMLRRQWSVTKSGPLSGGDAGEASPLQNFLLSWKEALGIVENYWR